MSGAWEHVGQRVHINGVVLVLGCALQCCRVVLAARGVLRRRCARLVEDPCGRGGYCQQVCESNYRNWANAIVRDIDVGPWACFRVLLWKCSCVFRESFGVFFEQSGVYSTNVRLQP